MKKCGLIQALVVLLITLAPTALLASGAAPGVTGWEALARIQAGNQRFVTGDIQYRPDPESRAVLAGGQKPHTIVVTCSDSRLPPELIFDQGLGEIFTIRAAGNVLDDYGIASIEYAVEHLGAALVVIMGHEACGAVGAALSTPRGKSAGSPSLDVLVRDIQNNLNGNTLFTTSDKLLTAPVKTNVDAVTQQLIKRSPVIRHALGSGKLVIGEAIYSLTTGSVSFWYVGVPVVPAHGVAGHAGAGANKAGHGHGAPPKKASSSKKKARTAGHGAAAHGAVAPAARATHPAPATAAAAPHAAPAAATQPTAAPAHAAGGGELVGNPFEVPAHLSTGAAGAAVPAAQPPSSLPPSSFDTGHAQPASPAGH